MFNSYSVTTISSLPYTISTPGDYYLNQSLTTTGDAITVSASNVNLNCLGFNLTGDKSGSDSGIVSSSGYSNVNISNCNLNKFQNGIVLWNSPSSWRIENVTAYNNSASGFYLYNPTNAILNNITSYLNVQGISIASNGNTILNSQIYNNSQVTFYFSSNYCNQNITNVVDNLGKYQYFSNQTTIIDGWTNVSSITLCGTTNSLLSNLNSIGTNRNNTFLLLINNSNLNVNNVNVSNYYYGINIGYGFLNSNITNVISNNSHRPFYLDSTYTNSLIQNLTIYNSQLGLYITNPLGYNLRLDNISSFSNAGTGFILAISSVSLSNIFLYNNTGFGIDYPGSTGFINSNFTNITIYGNSQGGIRGWLQTAGNRFNNVLVYNNVGEGITLNGDNHSFYNIYLVNNSAGGYVQSGIGKVEFINVTIINTTYGINGRFNNSIFRNISMYNTTYGYYASSASYNTTWDNFTIINSRDSGMFFQGIGYNNTFRDFEIRGARAGSYGSGIYLYNGVSFNNTFYNFNILNSSPYAMVLSSLNNTFYNFELYNNSYGLSIVSSNNTLYNFSTHNNSQAGIFMGDGFFNNVSNFTSYYNGLYGIWFSAPFSNINYFSNFNVYNNSAYGLYLSQATRLVFSNFNLSGQTYNIYLVTNSNNNSFSNFRLFNATEGIYSQASSSGNNFTNFTIYDTSYALRLLNSANLTFFNGTIYNSSTYDLYMSSISGRNIFYGNHFENISKFYSSNWSNQLIFFNYTLPSVGNIGNYWNNLTSCSQTQTVGSYEVCTTPGNYTINQNNNYDYAPLVLPSINASYVSGPEGNYYVEDVYIEVNASKNITSCVLYWNLAPIVMSVSNNTCYITQSGTFGNSYEYYVLVTGVNLATTTTSTRNVTLIDLTLDYITPPTLRDNVNRYNLDTITIEFSDDGRTFTNCIAEVNNVNYSMSYSGGICSYNYSVPSTNLTSQEITFQAFYNISGTITALSSRTVTIYSEVQTDEHQVPSFAFNSLILFLLTILGGFLLN